MEYLYLANPTDAVAEPYNVQLGLLRLIKAHDKLEAEFWKKRNGTIVYPDNDSIQTLEERWKDDTSVIVRLVEGAPVGFIQFDKSIENGGIKWLNIHSLYVHPDDRRKGYGKGLMNQVRMLAKWSSVDQLCLSVHALNKSAQLFYKSEGFVDQTRFYCFKL